MGNPQSELKFVHVAGTNGKGSICAMRASIMHRAGFKTGLYTAPYLRRFNERMQINGKQIEDNTLAEIVTEIQRHADAMDEAPNGFEMMTAAALRWFADSGCDIVVLEVGLGGRYDATNVIPPARSAASLPTSDLITRPFSAERCPKLPTKRPE